MESVTVSINVLFWLSYLLVFLFGATLGFIHLHFSVNKRLDDIIEHIKEQIKKENDLG